MQRPRPLIILTTTAIQQLYFLNQSYEVHIMPLVINSLRGRHTYIHTHTHIHKYKHIHTQTHTHTYRRPHRNNFKKRVWVHLWISHAIHRCTHTGSLSYYQQCTKTTINLFMLYQQLSWLYVCVIIHATARFLMQKTVLVCLQWVAS